MGRDRSETAVVLFPGALGRVETLQPVVMHMARRRFTLALGYRIGVIRPETISKYVRARLDHAGCERAHFVGFSLGAQLARLSASRLPSSCASLVLVGAGAPDRLRGECIARMLPLLRLIPVPILRARWRRELDHLLRGDEPATVDARARLLELVASMPRHEFVRARELLAALDRDPAALEPVAATMPTLRIDLGADEVISAEERARLASLVPHAEIVTLPGLGHGATLVLPFELLSRIESWCER